MSQNDLIGLTLSYIYAFGLLLIVEAIGKSLNWPQHFTRKIVHIGAGMWIWGILYFFDNWYYGIIPFATFIILNYIFYRKETFKAMDKSGSTPGTVYFAFSITVLFLLFWRTGSLADRVPVAAAAVMTMTWGDALASILGRKYGKKTYTVFGHSRSYFGSLVMFITSLVAISLTLLFLPGSVFSPLSRILSINIVLIMSIAGALIATLAESVAPRGTDNLTVPLLTALILWLFLV